MSPVTVGLLALLLVHAIGIPVVLRFAFGTPREETIVGHFERFVRSTQSADSWRPMAAARAYALEHPRIDLYEEIFFRRKVKFQYAPSSLLFIGNLSRDALNVISWCAVWITIGLTVLLFRSGVLHARDPALLPAGRFDLLVACMAVAGLCLAFYPLIKGYTLGQIQVWVNAMFACVVWAWYRGWKVSAGMGLGLACLIKPPLAPVALWALVRREWRLLAGAAGACGAGLALSIATYGLSSHLSYLRVLAFISQRGEAYYPNHSFNGLLNRWLSNGDNLAFQDFEFSPANPIVTAGTTIAAIVLLLFALVLPAMRRDDDGRFDLPIMALTATIVSPIAWEHHYGIVLPIFAVLVPAMLEVSAFRRWTAASLAASYVLIGQYVEPAQRLSETAFNPLQSYVLLGALLLLATAYAAIVRHAATPPARNVGREASL